MNLAVVGVWHQGAVASACLASIGHQVVGYDPDANLVARLNSSEAALYEPGLNELLRVQLDSGRLSFSNDLAGAVQGREVVCLMFDTPVDENDQSDLTIIYDAVTGMAPHLQNGVAIYVTAQVPVGTCAKLGDKIRELAPELKFGIAYSPENLRLGQAIDRFKKPPLPVLGSDDDATWTKIAECLAGLGAKWERTDTRTAEMTKHALNAFLAVSICFANELGNICDFEGADGKRVAEVLRLEPRVGPRAMLFPGLGFSGGTLARDMQTLRGLGDRHGIDTMLLDGAWNSNDQQNQLVVRNLGKLFGGLAGRKVAVLGLTYKPDTSTLRRSASLAIIRDLVDAGAEVAGHDPMADRAELATHDYFTTANDVYDAAAGADAVVLVTAWSHYKAIDFGRLKSAMRGNIFFDTNDMFAAEAVEPSGLRHINIGRGRIARA